MTLPFTVAEMFAVEVDEAVLNASQIFSADSTTFCTLSVLPVAVLAAFLATDFLAEGFLAEGFLAGVFLATAFLATAFLGAAFLAVVFFGVGLFAMLDRLVHLIPWWRK